LKKEQTTNFKFDYFFSKIVLFMR